MATEIAVVLKLVGEQFATGLSKAQKDLQEFGTRLARMAAPLAGVGVAMGGVVAKAANYGEDLKRASQSIGVHVEQLSALRYAAQLSEVEQGDLEQGLKKLSRTAAEASENAKKNAETFGKIGVSVKDTEGKVRPIADILLDVSNKFAQMEDSTEKTALSMQLFGKSGTTMIPLLNEGADGIKRMTDEAAKLGLVLTEEQAKAGDTFNDNLTTMGKLMEGITVQLGTAFIPAINSLFEAIKPIILGISDWAKANPKLMEGLVAVAAVLGAGGAVAIAVAAFGAMLAGLAIVGGPILLVSAGIAAIVGALVAFRKEISNAIAAIKKFIDDGIKYAEGFITTFAESMMNKLGPIIKAAETVANVVGRFLKPGSGTEEGPWEDLDTWGERFVQTIAEGIDRETDTVRDAAKGVAEAVNEEINPVKLGNELSIRGTIPVRTMQSTAGLYTSAVKRTGQTFFEGFNEGLDAFVKRAQDSFAQGVVLADAAARAMGEGFSEFFFDIVDGKIESFKDAMESLLDTVKNIVKEILHEIIRIATVRLVGAAFSVGMGGAGGGAAAPEAAFQHGGSFIVPGAGGTDSRRVAFRASPGERVTVSPPGQREPAVNVVVNNYTSDQVSVSQGRGPQGQPLVNVLIQAVKEGMNRGEFDKSMLGNYGMRRQGVSR